MIDILSILHLPLSNISICLSIKTLAQNKRKESQDKPIYTNKTSNTYIIYVQEV